MSIKILQRRGNIKILWAFVSGIPSGFFGFGTFLDLFAVKLKEN
jgi:hypothetical protein